MKENGGGYNRRRKLFLKLPVSSSFTNAQPGNHSDSVLSFCYLSLPALPKRSLYRMAFQLLSQQFFSDISASY
jgi:hypothetical protein